MGERILVDVDRLRAALIEETGPLRSQAPHGLSSMWQPWRMPTRRSFSARPGTASGTCVASRRKAGLRLRDAYF